MKLVFCGTPQFAVPSLERLAEPPDLNFNSSSPSLTVHRAAAWS